MLCLYEKEDRLVVLRVVETRDYNLILSILDWNEDWKENYCIFGDLQENHCVQW